MKTKVLYNPLSDNRHGEQNAKKIAEVLKDEEFELVDLTKLDLPDYFRTEPEDEKIIVAGGDGTIHVIFNKLGGKLPDRPIYYYPTGNGNDFVTDIREKNSDPIIKLNDYIKDLPTVTVDGKKDVLFFNGVGYGIDGYCCEEGDKLKAQSDKPINYAGIAIKGILGKFKPRKAVVTVDGVKSEYDNVWLVPTMNGRYYGGGMNIAPGQDRLDPDKKLSVVVFRGKSKLKTLMVFPSVFKGQHVKHEKMVTILTGHEITVEFDQPTPLQVDGETYINVSSYTAVSGKPAVSEEKKETAANV